MSRKLLFLGGYYPPALHQRFTAQSKVALDTAAHTLQEALFKGLAAHRYPFAVINAPFLGSFPFYNRLLRVPGYRSPDGQITSVPYTNLAFYKRHDLVRRVKPYLLRYCHTEGGHTTLLFYNFSMLSLAPLVKKLYPNARMVLLVTDLREFMAADQRLLTRLNAGVARLTTWLGAGFARLTGRRRSSVYDPVDAFVLLSPYMRQRLPVGDKPVLVLEGIYNPPDEELPAAVVATATDSPPKVSYIILLYSGNLGRRYGIPQLLEAFTGIADPRYRLWICGDGDGLEEVLRCQRTDPRIVYRGVLPRSEVLLLQQQATLLINPRRSTDAYTRYSFPSKTMEYLASGTPVLMSRLASLPADYAPYLYFFDDESVEGMRAAILEIGEKPPPELQAFGSRARQFILSRKNASVQTARLIRLMEELG